MLILTRLVSVQIIDYAGIAILAPVSGARKPVSGTEW